MNKILKIINMKTIKKIFVLAVILLFFVPLTQVMAQPGTPPEGVGSGDEPIGGGGAPIGGGSLILMGLAVAYGGKKVFDIRKCKEETED